jgi:ELWxxDGT repeat protein
VFNSKIFFSANNGTLGTELWITDGTAIGTTLVKDIRVGTSTTSSSPNFFFELNNNLYFSANSGAGNVLFITDGTELGTMATGDPFIFNQVELNGLIYFVLTTDSNKLYEFNGTATSTVANLGTGVEAIIGANIAAFDGKIFCYMDYSIDEPTLGRELYAYDPATDIFTLIKDITGDATDSGISNFMVVGNELYFESGSGILWKTDGTNSGTVAVTAAASLSGVTSLFEWNGKLYFEGDAGAGDQLYVYDPVGDTLTNISNISGGVTTNDHDPSDFVELNGYLYYAGEVIDDTKQYLFRTNGTSIERLSTTIFDIDDLAVLNGKLYFEGDDGSTGNELYTLDPATLSVEGNTMEIAKVFPNPASDYIIVSKNFINATYAIYETSGKLIKEGIINSERVDFKLNTGMYIFKIKSNDSIITKKIIIK